MPGSIAQLGLPGPDPLANPGSRRPKLGDRANKVASLGILGDQLANYCAKLLPDRSRQDRPYWFE